MYICYTHKWGDFRPIQEIKNRQTQLTLFVLFHSYIYVCKLRDGRFS